MLGNDDFIGADLEQKFGVIFVDCLDPDIRDLQFLQVHGCHGTGRDGIADTDENVGEFGNPDLFQHFFLGCIGSKYQGK